MGNFWNEQYASAWTQSSIDCYKRGCNCNGCLIKDILETQCDMKRAVMELVRKLGAPSKNEKKLNPTEQKVVNAILAGANTKKEIAELAGITEVNAQTALSDMYELAEFDGVIYKNRRYKLAQFIEWVRGVYEEV